MAKDTSTTYEERPDGIWVRKPAGYLCEPDGTKSSTRLMALISLLAAIGFGGVGVLKPASSTTALNLVGMFLAGQVVGKGIKEVSTGLQQK